MKYAIILAASHSAPFIPAETSPTVLAVTTTALSPILTQLKAALLVVEAMVTAEGEIVSDLGAMAVRVENVVVPGDKLEQSGDVWHKAVGG